jgi:hypothetical protein
MAHLVISGNNPIVPDIFFRVKNRNTFFNFTPNFVIRVLGARDKLSIFQKVFSGKPAIGIINFDRDAI